MSGNKPFEDCTLAELKREAQRQIGMKKLKCPECGQVVLTTHIERNLEVVVFRCLFSATFDRGIQPEEAQARLDEFKTTGKMADWLKRGLF